MSSVARTFGQSTTNSGGQIISGNLCQTLGFMRHTLDLSVATGLSLYGPIPGNPGVKMRLIQKSFKVSESGDLVRPPHDPSIDHSVGCD